MYDNLSSKKMVFYLLIAKENLRSRRRPAECGWNDPSIENELKEKMVDDLYLQQIEFAKAANEDIRKYRLTQKE